MLVESIKHLDLINADDHLWNEFFSLEVQIHEEQNPDDEPLQLSTMKKNLINSSPFKYNLRYGIWKLDKLIAYGNLYMDNEKSPEYSTNKHQANAYIAVDKNYRRNGFGTEILEYLKVEAREYGRKQLLFWTTEIPGKRFLESKQGEIVYRNVTSRLQLEEVEWTLMEEWRSKGITKNPDIGD